MFVVSRYYSLALEHWWKSINNKQSFQMCHVFKILIFTTCNCSERAKVSAFSKLHRTRPRSCRWIRSTCFSFVSLSNDPVHSLSFFPYFLNSRNCILEWSKMFVFFHCSSSLNLKVFRHVGAEFSISSIGKIVRIFCLGRLCFSKLRFKFTDLDISVFCSHAILT